MNIGILRETRRWNDRRTAITPEVAKLIHENFPQAHVFAQSSKVRIFPDDDYRMAGVEVVNDISHCDVLIGVKEVADDALIDGKTYVMFSHVAKKQTYNQQFFREMARKKITLIDYEYLTDRHRDRLVAFGFWAGVVGAYYAFQGVAKRFAGLALPGPEMCRDLQDLHHQLRALTMPPLKVLLTGGGRVAAGALEIIYELGIKEVSPRDFLERDYNHAVFSRLDPEDYVARKTGKYSRDDFYSHPQQYESTFLPYVSAADVFIPCHFWDRESPHFFTPEQLQSADFNISLIADVSCDVPGPIPTTIRTSTIESPFYDVDPKGLSEKPAFSSARHITVMAVDNLPTALPLDASRTFSLDFYYQVLPALFGTDPDEIIQRATILETGKLTERFAYLNDFLKGNN
ncbi:NAD(P)-dependent oxidoreductase [Gaoshiqia sediminis]|uniref:Saccharopine dehydrogenase [NAD(+), L-lysine-forming] n=1 Tax=Gaoshiqia sediminis TaxID=2986998 RepID=A0AA41YD95_9BACT|nr:NAD(P)-dependent oxidoreductase [Gaoshiqia sediminis]MCW0484613.1 NAD(P)-dependent oxidoreductase [Gaoshiqia sediminis]